MTNNYQMIRQAIIGKQQVLANYRDNNRELCPHVIGTKRGNNKALYYQFGGTSSTGLQLDGSPVNWRDMFVDEMVILGVREGPWHTAPNHSRPQKAVDEIDVEVQL
jgi:hypothetical protein